MSDPEDAEPRDVLVTGDVGARQDPSTEVADDRRTLVRRAFEAGLQAGRAQCDSGACERALEALMATLPGAVHQPSSGQPADLDARQLLARLTPRQLQVMELLARGLTCRTIAFQLGIAAKTVYTHRHQVLHKLTLRNTAELARFAIRLGCLIPSAEHSIAPK